MRWSAPAELGRDQHEDEIDGKPVGRIEIDRALEAGEDAENLFALCELPMWDGDPVADPGRAEPLALQQRVEDLAGGQAGNERGALAHLLQGLLLAVYPQGCENGVRLDELG